MPAHTVRAAESCNPQSRLDGCRLVLDRGDVAYRCGLCYRTHCTLCVGDSSDERNSDVTMAADAAVAVEVAEAVLDAAHSTSAASVDFPASPAIGLARAVAGDFTASPAYKLASAASADFLVTWCRRPVKSFAYRARTPRRNHRSSQPLPLACRSYRRSRC